MSDVAVAVIRPKPCSSPSRYSRQPDSYREPGGPSSAGPQYTESQMPYSGYRSARNSTSSSNAPTPSERSDYVDVVGLTSPVESSPPSRSSSSLSVASGDDEQRDFPESEPEYHELRTVSNPWERPEPPQHHNPAGHHYHHHHHHPNPVPAPWQSFTSTPDLRRSFSGVSATDLGLFGSSDRFSSYLNFSSESLGSFKLSGSGDFSIDYDYLKSSQGTLDSGYGSMVLRGMVNDHQNLGSLKELSYTEVADTLLSLTGSRAIGSMPQISPAVGATPINPMHHADAAGRVARELVLGATGSIPVTRAPETTSDLPPNYRYHPSYDDYPTGSGQPHALPVSAGSYGNYRVHDPLYGNDALTTLRPYSSTSNDSLLHESSSSLLNSVSSLQDGPSRFSDTPYWAHTQSTPDVTAMNEASFSSSGRQATSPRNSAQSFPSRESIIKSTAMFEAHSSEPTITSQSESITAGSHAHAHGANARRSALRVMRGLREAPKPLTSANSSDDDGLRHYCHFCDKAFSRPSTLKTHIKTHMGEKPYLCQVCGKTFFQAANLTAHIRVHSGEKPFNCHVCGKHFSQSSSVKTHMRTHSGERPYTCSVCHKSFSDNSTLTKHQRIHSGQKPYRCSVCQQSFSQSGNLSRHMKVHSRSMDAAGKPLLVHKEVICVGQGSE